MGDLVHYVVGVLEEAQDAVVQLDAHVVPVLLQAEGAEVEVLQPVVVYLLCYSRLA